MLKNNGIVKKKLLCICGWIEYERTVLIPADEESAKKLLEEGVRAIYPKDCALGVDKLPFKATYLMMSAIAREGIRALSYEKAALEIQEKYHANVSSVHVEKITDYVGQVVMSYAAEEAEKAKAVFQKGFDKRKRHRRDNDILYLELDGAMVHLRDKPDKDKAKPGWGESKHAIAFHSRNLLYRHRGEDNESHEILKRDLTGYIGSAEEFENYFLALALRNHVESCSEVVVLSDGALWIQRFIEKYLPFATFILDKYHNKENAGKWANAVVKGKNQKKELADLLCDLIDKGDVQGLLSIAEKYKDKPLPPGIPNYYTYVKNHMNYMDYPTYEKAGYFVGSGAMESANIYLMQNRMKLSGQRWKIERGQGVLMLKAKYESENWNQVTELMRIHCYGEDDTEERHKLDGFSFCI
ncbi:MAG: hypothetical protein IJ708_11325 [Clostridia bacterium]|nr:hypothetical protein [Clostridia bacterium]